jgi:23S rRNA (cytidine2498-2'-O)-methyltransferase
MTSPHVQEQSASITKSSQDQFVFVACQQGAEKAIKDRCTPELPFRLAFSRPGLVTFKVPGASDKNIDQTLPAGLLARVSGLGLGNIRGEVAEEMVDQALELAGGDFEAVHVFQRDRALPGMRGFEPGPTELTEVIGAIFAAKLRGEARKLLINVPCPKGARVLDVIIVEPGQWLIGRHTANEIQQSWPGGVFPVVAPEVMVSRAYLKISEALAWSQLPVKPGDKVVEIGSAPGGSCQRLLDIGLEVTGVDPAEMDPLILEHPRFEHWRSKAAGMKRRLYSRFKWLTADANVAPNYTLEVVEDIVTYPTSRFQGLLLTFKLSSYDMLEQVEEAAERIRSWGFKEVKIRQLASNRRECCVAAQK